MFDCMDACFVPFFLQIPAYFNVFGSCGLDATRNWTRYEPGQASTKVGLRLIGKLS